MAKVQRRHFTHGYLCLWVSDFARFVTLGRGPRLVFAQKIRPALLFGAEARQSRTYNLLKLAFPFGARGHWLCGRNT